MKLKLRPVSRELLPCNKFHQVGGAHCPFVAKEELYGFDLNFHSAIDRSRGRSMRRIYKTLGAGERGVTIRLLEPSKAATVLSLDPFHQTGEFCLSSIVIPYLLNHRVFATLFHDPLCLVLVVNHNRPQQ
jgi:hypothetical protein